MGAREQLRRLQRRVEGVEAGAAGEERLVEVLIVYGDGFHQGAAQVHSTPETMELSIWRRGALWQRCPSSHHSHLHCTFPPSRLCSLLRDVHLMVTGSGAILAPAPVPQGLWPRRCVRKFLTRARLRPDGPGCRTSKDARRPLAIRGVWVVRLPFHSTAASVVNLKFNTSEENDGKDLVADDLSKWFCLAACRQAKAGTS